MEFDLKKILKALLLSSSEPLAVKDVQAVITRYHQQADAAMDEADAPEESIAGTHAGIGEQAVMRDLLAQVPSLLTSAQIREAMRALSQELEDAGDVYRIQEGSNGYRLIVSPHYADWVRLLRDEPRPQRLSSAALETLAIIAYRQPVTRAEIEAIRGVSADGALNKLLERELIHVAGRAELPGRPIQYASTAQFLEYCGLRSLEELPASDVLSPHQITEWIRQATRPQAIGDHEVGLPAEQEELPLAES